MKKQLIYQLLTIAGTATAAFISLAISTKKKSLEADEKNDILLNKNTDTTQNNTKNNSYHGYVPWGCERCGGPYPLCRDGCSAFDD